MSADLQLADFNPFQKGWFTNTILFYSFHIPRYTYFVNYAKLSASDIWIKAELVPENMHNSRQPQQSVSYDGMGTCVES